MEASLQCRTRITARSRPASTETIPLNQTPSNLLILWLASTGSCSFVILESTIWSRPSFNASYQSHSSLRRMSSLATHHEDSWGTIGRSHKLRGVSARIRAARTIQKCQASWSPKSRDCGSRGKIFFHSISNLMPRNTTDTPYSSSNIFAQTPVL